MRMLWALRNAELDVATPAAVASCRPTVARQHLSKLGFAGLVEGQRHSVAGAVSGEIVSCGAGDLGAAACRSLAVGMVEPGARHE